MFIHRSNVIHSNLWKHHLCTTNDNRPTNFAMTNPNCRILRRNTKTIHFENQFSNRTNNITCMWNGERFLCNPFLLVLIPFRNEVELSACVRTARGNSIHGMIVCCRVQFLRYIVYVICIEWDETIQTDRFIKMIPWCVCSCAHFFPLHSSLNYIYIFRLYFG